MKKETKDYRSPEINSIDLENRACICASTTTQSFIIDDDDDVEF